MWTLNIKGTLKTFEKPAVMGIINLTPDSFHSKSRFDSKRAVDAVARMLDDGASIIDVGACSTRPGSIPCTEAEEWERLKNGLNSIRNSFPDVLLSVDTFRSTIAEKSVRVFGADIINDVSGGEADKEMLRVVSELGVTYILTDSGSHGDEGEDIISRVLRFFGCKLKELEMLGVADVLLDPGIGFGKTLDENYGLLKNLDLFKRVLGKPLLIGVSRKSLITKSLGIEPNEALNATTVLNSYAIGKGADVIRVHDVKEAVEAVKIMSLLNQ